MKIAEGVHQIEGTMANCYYLDLDGGILIDSGTKGSAEKILSFLKTNSFDLKTVLITHYHMDHIGGLSAVFDSVQPEIFVPDKEVDVITGNAKPTASNHLISKIVGALAHPQPVSAVKPVSKYRSDLIEVMETHGHTPGSTSYYLKNERILFVGDAVVNGRKGLTINRTFTVDLDGALKSEQAIKRANADIILSGHGQPFHSVRK